MKNIRKAIINSRKRSEWFIKQPKLKPQGADNEQIKRT